MISDKILKKWRLEALVLLSATEGIDPAIPIEKVSRKTFVEMLQQIMRLTQELLDQNLVRSARK